MLTPRDRNALLFRLSFVGALLVHACLLVAFDGVQGGADLGPHLRLAQLMADAPALRSVYPPAYHVWVALIAPWFGTAAATRLFAFAAAAGLLAGFRFFQRAAGLPDLAAALFAWSPYTFALTWCAPKVEAAGYALALTALGLLLRRRHAALAAVLAGTFLVHTAAALFLGLAGGVMALTMRDRRALVALAVGSAAAMPLLWAHLAAGCSLAQALLLSPGDYLRSGITGSSRGMEGRITVLAGPIGLLAAAMGVTTVWRRNRPVAALCAVIAVLYLNELWLAPFGASTTLNLLRGLTLLAIGTAICGGVALSEREAIAPFVVVACAVWGTAAAALSVPGSCHTRSFAAAEISRIHVDRCSFRWRVARPAGRLGGSGLDDVPGPGR